MRNPRSVRLSAALLICATCLPASLWAQSSDTGEARLAALLDRVETLERQTREIEDLTAIQRLQRAYGYYIDKGFWHEAVALFSADASFEIAGDGVYRGRERIRELLVRHGGGNDRRGPGLPFGRMNRHMQLQPVVSVGGDEAHARWRVLSLLGQYKVDAYWGDAVMENTYAREDGVWKIRSLRLFPNFVAPYEGGWSALEPATGELSSEVAKAFPPDQPPGPDYRRFPEVFVPPFHYAGALGEADPAWAGEPVAADAGSAALGALAELEAMADRFAAELANLKSERAIENLQAMFGYYIDKGLWDEAAALFTSDASYEYGQGGVYLGRERIRQALGLMGPAGLEPGLLNNYITEQPIISVAPGSRSARARFRSDIQWSRGGEGRWGGGVYENEYQLEDGVWKISKLHFYVTFWADYDEGWPAGTVPMRGVSAELPPDLPPTEVYGSQPEVHLFPFHYPHLVTGEAHKGDAGAREQEAEE